MTTAPDITWLDRLMPLPKEIAVRGSLTLPARRIVVACEAEESPPVRTAVGLLSSFARGETRDAALTMHLALLKDAPVRVPGRTAWRLRALPNREQAYCIYYAPHQRLGREMWLIANTPQGLLYAARTLTQLVRPPAGLEPETRLDVPLAQILDWPDLSERGQWGGNVADDLAWTSQWKLNVVEVSAGPAVDAGGKPVVNMSPELLEQGARLGVKVVPYIAHLEQLSRYAGLMEREEYTSTPDPSKPLPSDYTPGMCMSSPATQELVRAWLAAIAALPEVTDICVWLSEDAAPCFCEHCLGKEPFGLEVACIVSALRKVQQERPRARLRLLTTQGSYPVNDKIIAATPRDVGITYYDGGRTYDSSRKPMIYPLLEEYAQSGGWLGVYPQITHAWRTVFPWSGPQFLRYRAQEFADKRLDCMIGYAVPSNRFHEFNVAAMAEWTWNSRGRSPEEFARAYATGTGICDPDLFSRWAVPAGEAGWALAESRLLLTLIFDPAFGLTGSVPFDHRFQAASIAQVEELAEAIAAARQARELARQAGITDMIDESECALAGLEAFRVMRLLSGLLRAPSLDDEQRTELAESLDTLDQCARTMRTRLVDWGERVMARSGGGQAPDRLIDTACALLRTCDAARAAAAKLGVPDPRPESRLRRLQEWSAAEFADGPELTLSFDLAELVPPEGGSYQLGFDFRDSAWGTDITRIAVVSQSEAGVSTLAQTPDILKRLSIWERWCELRIEVPERPRDARLLLEIGLRGLPADAPEGRRTCSGAVGIRRVWESGEDEPS